MQPIQTLRPSCLSTSLHENGDLSLTIYHGELTTQCVIDSVKKMKQAFPGLTPGFYDVLADRVKENKFSDQRLMDAVNHVIDTCIYPTPTIANFISFDKRIKMFRYSEMCKMSISGDRTAFKNHKPIKFREYPVAVWIHVNDIAFYNIEGDPLPEEVNTQRDPCIPRFVTYQGD